MAKKDRLKDIEKQYGVPLEEIIPPLVNKLGQPRAARVLGVSQTTIHRYLKANGYTQIVRWERTEKVLPPC